jgi:hypothetical protein
MAKNVESDGVKTGFGGGLSIDKYFEKNYALSTGLYIGTQGGKLLFQDSTALKVYDDTEIIPKGSVVEYKLQYLTIPIGLKLKSNAIGYYSFFANLGFTNQFNLKATASSNNQGGLDDDSIKEEISLYNLGYHFGGGIEYALGEDTALSLSIIICNGFWDITSGNPTVNSRTVALKAGIIF